MQLHTALLTNTTVIMAINIVKDFPSHGTIIDISDWTEDELDHMFFAEPKVSSIEEAKVKMKAYVVSQN